MALVNKRWDRQGLDHENWLNERFLRRAGHIFVHSEALRDRVLAAAIPPERVTFAIHPVAKLPSKESDVADRIKAQHNGRRFIVVFGFPHPRKSLELAIQALPALPPDIMLLFVGGVEGSFRQQYVQSLLQLAQDLGVHDRTEFVGEVPEPSLRAVFESAQFALAPFTSATGSGSFAYLMAAGVPIVASDLPEHRMLHREGAGLALFENGNVSALASAVNGLLHDRERRETLSMKSTAFANRNSFASFAESVAARLQALASAK